MNKDKNNNELFELCFNIGVISFVSILIGTLLFDVLRNMFMSLFFEAHIIEKILLGLPAFLFCFVILFRIQFLRDRIPALKFSFLIYYIGLATWFLFGGLLSTEQPSNGGGEPLQVLMDQLVTGMIPFIYISLCFISIVITSLLIKESSQN